MSASNYSFADLLHIFYALRMFPDELRTYGDLAETIGASRRAVAGWFAGDYVPGKPDLVIKLARAFGLTQLQADLMLYTINPMWVHYGTPIEVLESVEVLRHRESIMPYPLPSIGAPPPIYTIEQEWEIMFQDQFTSNYNRWGLGTRDVGYGILESRMVDGHLLLTLQNRFHEICFMGALSACFTSPIYYASVHACLLEPQASTSAGYVMMFESMGDNCHAIFRVRDKDSKVSVVQTFDGQSGFNIYLNRVDAPSVRSGETNKIAILAVHDKHWFYVNDALVGTYVIPRYPRAHLDLGVVANGGRTVTCRFDDFQVRVPKALDVYSSHNRTDERFVE